MNRLDFEVKVMTGPNMTKKLESLILQAVVKVYAVTSSVIRVRPIPVLSIGRYLPVLVGIGIGQYLF